MLSWATARSSVRSGREPGRATARSSVRSGRTRNSLEACRGEGTGKRLDSWPGGGGHMKMWICRGGGGPWVRTPGKNPGAGGVGRLGRASRRPATGEGSGRNSRRAGWHQSQSTGGRQAQPPEQSAPPVLGWPSRCFLQPSLSLPATAATVHRSPQGPARRGGPGAPRPVLGGSQAQRGRPEFGAGRRGLGGPGRTVAPRGHSLQLPCLLIFCNIEFVLTMLGLCCKMEVARTSGLQSSISY